jgi:hypothetical protein
MTSRHTLLTELVSCQALKGLQGYAIAQFVGNIQLGRGAFLGTSRIISFRVTSGSVGRERSIAYNHHTKHAILPKHDRPRRPFFGLRSSGYSFRNAEERELALCSAHCCIRRNIQVRRKGYLIQGYAFYLLLGRTARMASGFKLIL